jgi:phosphoribosyl 1,2-cyclic phosphodiesterase
MRVAVLGSGSKGNCLLVQSGDTTVMVDAGFGARETRRRLQAVDAGFDWRKLNGLLLTHAHGDHVKGAAQLSGGIGMPTYCTAGTQRFASTFTSLKNVQHVTPGEHFQIGCLRILATKTVHDEPGSVCYTIDDGDQSFGIVTDLGEVSTSVGAALHGVDTLVVEHNHDARMLREGPYSAHLKRRIASRYGHLNNDKGSLLLGLAKSSSLSRVLLAHLSEVNNTPALALASARPVVDGLDVDLAIAPQHHPSPWLRVRYRPTTHGTAVAVASSAIMDAEVSEPTKPVQVAAAVRHLAMERHLELFSSTPVNRR